MMDTCADYYSNLSGPATSSSTLNSCIKGSEEASGAAGGGGGGGVAGSANNNLSSFGSATSTRNSSQSNVHPLLQHTTHPQHLIAPVAPQLATAAPPAAIVAPTITNHHPQQPNKFTLGNHGATGYSSSASGAAVGAQSVVNGTSTGGHHNQATVYPLQHSHLNQHQAKNTSSPPLLLVDNLKTSVITENPYEYHHHQQQQQQLQHQQHHLPAHNNYVAAASGNTTHNLWSPTDNARSDHASVNSGYLDRGSFNASCILSGSSVGSRLHGDSGSVGGGTVSESALEYNLNSYGESSGTHSNLVNYDTTIYQANYGGATTGATTSGRGVDGGPAGLSTTPTVNDSQSMADYQSSAGSNSSKCNYNSSSSPLSQTATSPFQQYTGSISQQPQLQDYSTINGGVGSGGGAVSIGGSNMHGLAGNGLPSGRTLYNTAMRSNHPFDSSNAAANGTIPLDYQQYPQSQQVDSVASLDAMTQRTYMDLSGSKPQSNSLTYYPPSHAIPPKTTKRFSGYDDPGAQYVMPENYYNGYKAHASIHPHVVAPIPSHANQMNRAHYNRQGGGGAGGVVTGTSLQAPSVSQMDSKMYRRNYAKHPAVHLNYASYHQYAGSNAAYSTDPLTTKRPPSYHPQATAAGHQQMSYTDQQLYELESAKKKAAAYQSSTGGKYPYPSPGSATGSYMTHSGPAPTSGQYSGMIQPGMHGNARPMCNYYPNGYMNYPMGAGTHPVTQQQSGGGSVGVAQSPAMNGYNPNAMNGAEMFNHPNYLKSARHLVPHQMESSAAAAAMAMGKHHNRNCYYDTNVPPAGEKTYVDLEDQISGSKITKSRVGYPVNMDYHHQGYYDPHYPPQNHPSSHSHPGLPRYNAKYPQERYLYYPPHAHPQLHSHYQQQQQQQQHRLHQQMQPYPLAGPGHYSSHPQDPTSFHAAQAHHQFASNGKKTNVRDFLSSWNDDEEEGAAPMGDGSYASGGQLNNLQRIQVGISIDKSSLMDSTGTMNLPDIIVDIEKQKPVIPEIDLTDDGNEICGAAAGADTASPTSEEKLYVLESIDVPLSELNKYKHLNVINKLPENIVHLKEGGADGAEPPAVFNESEMIHTGVEPVTTTQEAGIPRDSGVENSIKFIEEIESSSDFKNDFELNVEYESFPNQQKLQPEVTSSTSPSRDDLKSGMEVEPSLAELVTKAEDMIARQRKESVIVAVKKKVKSENGKKKRKLKKALKAQLKEEGRRGWAEAEKETINSRRSSATGEVDSDSETVCPRNNFKSLVKCCLDRINSKPFRRNASRYLCVGEGEVVQPITIAQEGGKVLTVPEAHMRHDRQSVPPKHNPKSLREICAETVISANLVTIQEDFDGVEDKEECGVALIPLDGQVPLLRDLCEQVLSQNNFIINLEDFYQMDNHRILLADKELPFEGNDNSLDDNNNHHLPLISGLSNAQIDEEEEERDGHCSSVDSPAFSLTAPNPAPCHADAPHSDVEMSAEFDPYCDYFLAEPEDGDQIQFSEEVVPVDPDQHKRRQFADQMRLKYVHNNQTNHALDARRVLLKKYFYYQRHVAMVSRGMWQWRRTDRRPSAAFISVLRKQYRRAMLCRQQRWSKRSKTIRMEPMTSPVIGQLPQLPIAISPRATVSQTSTTTTKTHSKNSVSAAAANNETILKLIKEGIADMARKSVAPEDTRPDKSDTQVIMVTVERARVVEERTNNSQRSSSASSSSSSSSARVESDLGHGQTANKEKEMNVRRKKERYSDHSQSKAEAGEEERKRRNKSKTKYQTTSKDRGSAKRWPEEEKNPSRTNPLNPINESKEESQPTTSVTKKNVLQEDTVTKCARPKKKIKPKFDDILLGIDDMYKSSSTPPTIVSKVKPTNNIQAPWKARKTLEIIELSDCSVSSPSSVLSSSTTSSSGSSSSSSSSLSSTSSSSSSSSSKSAKSAKTSNSRGRSSDVPSSAGRRTYNVSGNSNSARCSSSKERVTEKSQNKPKVRPGGGGERGVHEERSNDKVQPGNKRKSSEVVVEGRQKEKLIIKTAVVQLERNGYIDKLGKLYT